MGPAPAGRERRRRHRLYRRRRRCPVAADAWLPALPPVVGPAPVTVGATTPRRPTWDEHGGHVVASISLSSSGRPRKGRPVTVGATTPRRPTWDEHGGHVVASISLSSSGRPRRIPPQHDALAPTDIHEDESYKVTAPPRSTRSCINQPRRIPPQHDALAPTDIHEDESYKVTAPPRSTRSCNEVLSDPDKTSHRRPGRGIRWRARCGRQWVRWLRRSRTRCSVTRTKRRIVDLGGGSAGERAAGGNGFGGFRIAPPTSASNSSAGALVSLICNLLEGFAGLGQRIVCNASLLRRRRAIPQPVRWFRSSVTSSKASLAWASACVRASAAVHGLH